MTKHEEILSKMTPEQKLHSVNELITFARNFKASYLRQEHPEWSEKQIWEAVKEWFVNAD